MEKTIITFNTPSGKGKSSLIDSVCEWITDVVDFVNGYKKGMMAIFNTLV